MIRTTVLLLLLLGAAFTTAAQQITGVWHGRIDRKKVELKIVQRGDSLTGTAYYHDAGGGFRRYSIKGYFDPLTNSAVWWDDRLITEKSGMLGVPGKVPQHSVADFNCPGAGQMFLEGAARPQEEPEGEKGPVSLAKGRPAQFHDEWDWIIDNWTAGTSRPELIDSVALIAFSTPHEEGPRPGSEPRREGVQLPRRRPGMVVIGGPPAEPAPPKPQPAAIEEKFAVREKKLLKEIPLTGDSIELRFYDNAQVDGDSISLFLNGRLVQEHIRLSDVAYVLKLAVSELADENELIMVAENLGSIPPNTSHMVALMGRLKYGASLASTEQSSAMIRLYKERIISGK